MTTAQPLALKLADELDDDPMGYGQHAAELRRQHAEIKALPDNTALLRQALEQLEINRTNFRKGPSKSICKMLAGGNDEAITALRERLK